MTEGLADTHNAPTSALVRLYERWGQGGAGLLLTGNVQVDPHHLERPGNVVLAGTPTPQALAALTAWSIAARQNGAKVLMQLNHAGRQTPVYVNARPSAPSDVPLNLPGKVFGSPRSMETEEIDALIVAFANAAEIAQQTGFDGVQIHAAHGYLISQFLSPLSNRRSDKWGGPLACRVRFLLAIITAVRARCGDGFTLSVKLNSSDFQKGGFSETDALAVTDWLRAAKIDLLEISGGTYERPRMAGLVGIDEVDVPRIAKGGEEALTSTRKREAYFQDFAKLVRARANMPVMVTGGWRNRGSMQAALAEGDTDLIGLGRPLCAEPEACRSLLTGESQALTAWEQHLRLGPGRFLGPNSPVGMLKLANGWGTQGWYCLQLLRMGAGLQPDLKMPVWKALLDYRASEMRAAKALHRG